MRFPFLAAEYTNICAFATFRESSAVELLTGQKFCGPAGSLRRPGAVRCAAPWALPSAVIPDPSPLRLAVPRTVGCAALRALPARPMPVGRRPRDACRWSRNVYTFPHLANTPGGFGPAAGAVRRVTPSLQMQDVGPCAHGSGCKMWVRAHTDRVARYVSGCTRCRQGMHASSRSVRICPPRNPSAGSASISDWSGL